MKRTYRLKNNSGADEINITGLGSIRAAIDGHFWIEGDEADLGLHIESLVTKGGFSLTPLPSFSHDETAAIERLSYALAGAPTQHVLEALEAVRRLVPLVLPDAEEIEVANTGAGTTTTAFVRLSAGTVD